MSEVRDTITRRITIGRVKLEARRASGPFLVLVLAALGTAFAAAWFFSKVVPSLVNANQAVAFEVGSARAVKPGLSEVRVKGIPAGRITDVELRDGRPVVIADVDRDFGTIYRDARAELRPNSALEDQYIDIVDRGTPSAGEADADEPLPPSQTELPVPIDEILATFDGDTRARLRTLLAELGKGLGDRGAQLGQALVEVVPLLEVAGDLGEQVGRRDMLTRRLVHNARVLTAELGRRERQLRTLLRTGSETMAALRQSEPALDATLRNLPPMLAALDSAFRATRGVLGDVDRAVVSLRPVAEDLDDALASVRELSKRAAPAVARLERPVERLVPLTRVLEPLSDDLQEVVERLRPQIDTVDKVTRNLANCKKGVQGFFHWDASMTKYGDSRGQAPRGNLGVGIQTLGLASPAERAYSGCTPGAPIGGRPPREEDMR